MGIKMFITRSIVKYNGYLPMSYVTILVFTMHNDYHDMYVLVTSFCLGFPSLTCTLFLTNTSWEYIITFVYEYLTACETIALLCHHC